MDLCTAFFHRAKRNSLSDGSTSQVRCDAFRLRKASALVPHRQCWSEAHSSHTWPSGGDWTSGSTRSPPLLPLLPWLPPEPWSQTWWVALDPRGTRAENLTSRNKKHSWWNETVRYYDSRVKFTAAKLSQGSSVCVQAHVCVRVNGSKVRWATRIKSPVSAVSPVIDQTQACC